MLHKLRNKKLGQLPLPAFPDVGCNLLRKTKAGFFACPGNVGGKYHPIRMFGVEQWTVCGKRFLDVDVYSDSGYPFFVNGTGQVRFVGNPSASGVDQEGGGFHETESLVVYQAGGLLIIGGMDADHVSLAKKGFQ